MDQYAALRNSIYSAVQEYESYKSQSIDTKSPRLEQATNRPSSGLHGRPGLGSAGSSRNVSREQLPTLSSLHASERQDRETSLPSPSLPDRRDAGSPSPTRSAPAGGFDEFLAAAESYESQTLLIDLLYLQGIVDFMRSEHPYTSNTLRKAMDARNKDKRKLWQIYTNEMQGLARAYSSGKPLPSPVTSSLRKQSARYDVLKVQIAECKKELRHTLLKLDKQEQTCAETVMDALVHLHRQAIMDARRRYAMADPIHDKTTPIEAHNERARVFNQIVKFVADDLRRIETLMRHTGGASGGHGVPATGKDKKKGAGVVEAVEALNLPDYPPFN
ncbi:hypothetical protein BCR37DRAFT_391940 [Protomyces lactucae-debilis]|uniref:Uncharacterized protein n=1 Tax=Protomyces lactucae-debilis TaxID=2754530 RepID=A0A1Y2FK52_PROLT|nr:uncharacterized protein BCR37DRAFT_391940 [Protomyces lactucae-debilis]ORY84352.1 hypothetical protein BCR37DRAFT_391940 [Protomyces lactucae-debilis]